MRAVKQGKNTPPAVRTLLSVALLAALASFPAKPAQAARDQVAQFEAAGDLASAQALLTREAQSSANDPLAQQSLAEFLCRHRDGTCRDATAKWASAETDATKKKFVQRQLLL